MIGFHKQFSLWIKLQLFKIGVKVSANHFFFPTSNNLRMNNNFFQWVTEWIGINLIDFLDLIFLKANLEFLLNQNCPLCILHNDLNLSFNWIEVVVDGFDFAIREEHCYIRVDPLHQVLRRFPPAKIVNTWPRDWRPGIIQLPIKSAETFWFWATLGSNGNLQAISLN